ncbi:hypothetical protein MJO28_008494 [Puccinia striiformis f. sp. tritici]|uniref:Uncharacterized protein n=1 Tax=Puccinia striiformis f. sp. tritici TaxID=168172 RepID=A0ACC0EC57_9BASI|nr:hypothetical protein MJO28_008494 [Puccinia striiformis f. sp. tritici]
MSESPQAIITKTSQQARTSWVWGHFVEIGDKVQCIVCKPGSNEPCDKKLSRDTKSSSTKSMLSHLLQKHQLMDPKKYEAAARGIENALKRQKNEGGREELSPKSLKKAIAFFIADADLCFSIVTHDSFWDLLGLLNPAIRNGEMTFGRKTIALEVHHLYGAHSEYLKKFFKSLKHVAFTLDAWTSPNTKAFMAITAHAISSTWQMIDVVVAMPVVHGAHTGFNFAETFLEVLERYELSNSIVSITADNASNNSTLASRVEQVLEGHFIASDQLLGCMAHVINLAAKDGLGAFRSPTDETTAEDEITLDQMDHNTFTTRLDGTGINLRTVITRIHGLTTHVRLTPQRRAQFVSFLPEAESPSQTSDTPSNEPKKNPKEEEDSRMLIPDVKTRWNSTYLMLKRALELRVACNKFCRGSEARKYSLNPVEWEKVAQMSQFLEPLYHATLYLCRTGTPTLNITLPFYKSLVKLLLDVRSQHDASQLLAPAHEMITKLKKYLVLALKKTAPLCAMILDPRIKMIYFEKHVSFLEDNLQIKTDTAEMLCRFKDAARPFNHDVFGCIHTTTDLKSEIHRYLNELAEPTETRILEYWHRKQDIYPSLSAMAKCFLAIPATSASSERVFSKSKTIVGPQRASLSATSIEHTLCLKEWYRSTGNLDSLPYDEKDFDDDFGQPEYC